MAVQGKYLGFALYSQKDHEMKRWEAAGETGFTNEQSTQGGAFGGDLLDQKAVPTISGGGWCHGYKCLVH